jgi:hypothetical protein
VEHPMSPLEGGGGQSMHPGTTGTLIGCPSMQDTWLRVIPVAMLRFSDISVTPQRPLISSTRSANCHNMPME